MVRDDWRQIQSGLDKAGHLVPGLEHFTTVDTLDNQAFENHLIPVDSHIRRRNTQQGNLAAMVHMGQHTVECRRITGHLKADIEAFGHTQFGYHVFELLFGNVDSTGDTHLARKIQAVFVNISDHYMTCTNVFCHSRRHDTDRAGAGDQHVFTHQVK